MDESGFKSFLEGVQPGLGDAFAQKLWDKHIRSAGLLADAEPDDLVGHGIDKAVARGIIKNAQRAAEREAKLKALLTAELGADFVEGLPDEYLNKLVAQYLDEPKTLALATVDDLTKEPVSLPMGFALQLVSAFSGYATTSAPVPPTTQSQQLEVIMEQLETLKDTLALRGVAATDSATTLGDKVLAMAKLEELVVITAEARAAAERWLLKQPAQQQSALLEAMKPGSKLPEKGAGGVQDVFSKLLQKQLPDLKQKLHYVHDSTSVCRTFKPDAICTRGALIPQSCSLILELKKQDGAFNCAPHIHQIAVYGAVLLEQLPETSRTQVLVGVTDLRQIQFLRLTRQRERFDYALSPVMADVLPALCAVMLAPADQYGASPPPQLRYRGRDVELLSLLGVGATSAVYKVAVPAGGAKTLMAAKVPITPQSASLSNERTVLRELGRSSCPNIPEVFGDLDDGLGMLMLPVGIPLEEQIPCLFEVVGQAVDTLQAAHASGLVHRDIRPDNLLGTKDGALLSLKVIDWGFALSMALGPIPRAEYRGTVKFASNQVLTALEEGGPVVVEAADDLESLVKTMFALSHAAVMRKFAAVRSTEFAAIREFWGKVMEKRKTWREVMKHAADADYRKVKEGLECCLE